MKFFYSGNFTLLNKLKYLLNYYNLPINLKKVTKGRNKKYLINQIYNNIFLDKKKINNFPRYIKVNNIGKSKIEEMRDNSKIKKTIAEVLF